MRFLGHGGAALEVGLQQPLGEGGQPDRGAGRVQPLIGRLRFGDAECPADLPRQQVGCFDVARNRFYVASLRIAPELVFFAFPLEKATVPAKMP